MELVRATVKGKELDCYSWDDGDKLLLTHKIQDLSEDGSIALYQAVNETKGITGAVTTTQINIEDASLLSSLDTRVEYTSDGRPFTRHADQTSIEGEDYVPLLSKEQFEEMQRNAENLMPPIIALDLEYTWKRNRKEEK